MHHATPQRSARATTFGSAIVLDARALPPRPTAAALSPPPHHSSRPAKTDGAPLRSAVRISTARCGAYEILDEGAWSSSARTVSTPSSAGP